MDIIGKQKAISEQKCLEILNYETDRNGKGHSKPRNYPGFKSRFKVGTMLEYAKTYGNPIAMLRALVASINIELICYGPSEKAD